MKKSLLIFLMFSFIATVNAKTGKGYKSSRMIDYIKKMEESKRTGKSEKAYSEAAMDFLNRKSIGMEVELQSFLDYVHEVNDSVKFEALKELFVLTSDLSIDAERRVTTEKLLGQLVKLDKISVTKLKIDAPQILEAAKEWTTPELVELNNLLTEVLLKSTASKSSAQVLLEVIDPVLKTQAERKCM